MITKQTMFDPLLEVAAGFLPQWEAFLADWKGEEEPPYYLALAGLARYIAELSHSESEAELAKVFQVVERWHLEGDAYVKEAATVGLLENLQNTNVVGVGTPEKLERFLLPETKRWWDKVGEFWKSGKIISD